MKVAIFSGSIPSTTFIENLIRGVSNSYKVMLFGVKTKTINYPNNIKVFFTPSNKWYNLGITLYRSSFLLVTHPHDLFKLIRVVSAYNSLYERWIWFSKFLPIVLYRPDIFHMQWARDTEFYMFLKTEFSIPIVISLRGAHINYTPITEPRIAEIYKTYFPQVDAFHAVSQAISEEAQKYGAKASSINIIHSPVNNAVFNRFRAGKYLEQRNDIIKLISVGRFHWKKGYTYALKAVKLLKDMGYKVSYTIVSTNALPESLLYQIHQQDLNDCVDIVKGMSHDEVLSFVHNFDLMLLPSIEEGIANVVLEAMAMGVLVISTDCGGMAEVVKDKETGWLVPLRDPKAMALAVEDFLNTEIEKLNVMAENAHNLVKKEFDAENVISLFEKMYREVDRNNKKV